MKIIALLLLAISTLGLDRVGQGYAAVSSAQAVAVSVEPSLVAQASTLVTQDYIVTISQNCVEGDVDCDNVTYYGVNTNTGASLDLQGRTVHAPCTDGITPCRFMGYEFFNGAYRYFVAQNGTLQIFQNGQRILEQSGYWDTTRR